VGSGMGTTESKKTNAAGTRAPQNERAHAKSRCHISSEKRQLDILVGWMDNQCVGERRRLVTYPIPNFLIYVMAGHQAPTRSQHLSLSPNCNVTSYPDDVALCSRSCSPSRSRRPSVSPGGHFCARFSEFSCGDFPRSLPTCVLSTSSNGYQANARWQQTGSTFCSCSQNTAVLCYQKLWVC
jgi:hypothetical protein